MVDGPCDAFEIESQFARTVQLHAIKFFEVQT